MSSSKSTVVARAAVSLDGYMAGPDQSMDDPLGIGGERLHTWHFGGDQHPVDVEVADRLMDFGAFVMGRNMFSGALRGTWDAEPAASWRGWWGEDPPYHAPVFVLTHFPREPLEMDGGTTFHFVTDGVEKAAARAREVAGDRGVCLAGGASAIRQGLRAGLVDEVFLHLTPVLLGAGERPLDDVGDVRLEQVKSIASPTVTHLRYRVVR